MAVRKRVVLAKPSMEGTVSVTRGQQEVRLLEVPSGPFISLPAAWKQKLPRVGAVKVVPTSTSAMRLGFQRTGWGGDRDIYNHAMC